MQPRNSLLIFFFFIFCCGYRTNAQKDIWDKKIDELTNKGIDTLLFYFISPFNYWPDVEKTDTGICIYPRYLMWKEEGNVYVQKFISCFDKDWAVTTDVASCPVQLSSCKPYNFLSTYFNSILPEIILPGEIKVRVGNVDTCYLIKSFHSGSVNITIFLKGQQFDKGFDFNSFDNGIVYEADNRTVRMVQESVNYKYNVSTYTYRLWLLLGDFTQKVNAEIKFKYDLISK